MKIRFAFLQHYRMVGAFALASVLMLSAFRMLLILMNRDRTLAIDGLAFVLLQGVRFDIVLLSMLLAIPMLLVPVAGLHARTAAHWQRFLALLLPAGFGLLLFMELATPAFISEYGIRPNYLFFEYLEYPREVFSMLVSAYWPQLLLSAVLVPAAIIMGYRLLRRLSTPLSPIPYWQAAALVLLTIPVMTLGIRSTTGHRPVNPSTVAFSQDPLVNSLALNSSYSAAYALYERRHENAMQSTRLVLDKGDVLASIRKELGMTGDAISSEVPTLHHQAPSRHRERPLNLVIVVEESLGAEFVGALGSKYKSQSLTPNLDALADDGIWFEEMYATGTRSVQGLEAIVTGFLPTRASSTVKLPGSQDNFFTLAELLRRKGYSTSFLYGGDSDFDNMRRFFMNNGFETVVDEKDFASPGFRSSWGVSDGDLFREANHFLRKTSANGPFFSLLFTTSNHSPFEIPPGSIQAVDPGENTVNNAVHYADKALGEFLAAARKSDYWKDTIFLIVADHNSRVMGAEVVPIERFHIPAVILGADIRPQRIPELVSQVDLLPTLLSLMGVEANHPAIGRDLTQHVNNEHRGIVMRYHDTLAWRENDRVIIQRPSLPLEQYFYRNGRLEPLDPGTKVDSALAHRALVHFEWPVHSYLEHRYHLE